MTALYNECMRICIDDVLYAAGYLGCGHGLEKAEIDFSYLSQDMLLWSCDCGCEMLMVLVGCFLGSDSRLSERTVQCSSMASLLQIDLLHDLQRTNARSSVCLPFLVEWQVVK